MKDENDVRASLKIFPHWTQHFWTWLTGSPLSGQKPIFSLTPVMVLLLGLLIFAGGVFGSYLLINLPPFFLALLPLTWTTTVNGTRRLQVQVCHACVHASFSVSKRVNRVIYESLSTMLVIQNFVEYRADHFGEHHTLKLATVEDPDVKLLKKVGIGACVTKKSLWAKLYRTLYSPVFHALMTKSRLKSNFVSAPFYRKVMSVGFHAGLLLGVYATGSWLEYLFAYLFPVFLLHHCSALLQFVCEHRWLRVRQSGESAKTHTALLTFARFLGEPAPSSRSFKSWAKWALRMLVHLFFRLFVVVGDLPAHDFHHRHPSSREWPNALYARRTDVDAGHPGWKDEYQEVWGLGPAIDAIFETMSKTSRDNCGNSQPTTSQFASRSELIVVETQAVL